MDKSLTWKIALIIVLVLVTAWTLYPPGKTLKPGIDLAGGTSLIYQIDDTGLDEYKKRDLAQQMITVLRRRVDPANIRNLLWRPHGNTRFEIQMPLASAEAREKRESFEQALHELLDANVNTARIMRSLQKPPEQRSADFKAFSANSPKRMEILNVLAAAFDDRHRLQTERNQLAKKLQTPENLIQLAGLNLQQIKQNLSEWSSLDEQRLKKTLTEYLGREDNLDLLSRYVKLYAEWAEVVDKLTDPQSGKNAEFANAVKALDQLNLTRDQVNAALDLPTESKRRKEKIEELKTEFPSRKELIDVVVTAFDEYRPFRGRLDDPKDLQRMLQGAGILEFRILPTLNHPKVTESEMQRYVEALKVKGPKYASDEKYTWCEIEDFEQWQVPGSVFAEFGNKHYVLASNQVNEAILHSNRKKDWRLEHAEPRPDKMGRRAVGFTLDERGAILFANVTGKNRERPLCILLDGLAISAPNIQSQIFKRGVITGSFTQTEVQDLANKLNAGALPARLIEQPISVKTIGPSIGADNRDRGIKAGFIGLILVMLCMLLYYTLAGSVADVALLMNILFVLGIMALLRATFTLPGIAGIILTIGMSVDANVLIFERIREEQQRGSSLRIAIKNGYQRAFRTIFDANLTTFITAAILFWVASEEIKGFAIVLMLGIASSMFTALFVTRTVFDLLLSRRTIKEHLVMMQLIRKPNVNWMKARPVFLSLSAVLMVGGLFVFFTRNDEKNNKYDIEFTGGTSVQINLKPGTNLSRQQVEGRIKDIAAKLNNSALAAANIYSIGQSNRQYEITTTETNLTTATVTFSKANTTTEETVTSAIEKAQLKFRGRLNNLRVAKSENSPSFTVTTSQINIAFVKKVLAAAFPDAEISEPKVDEIVNDAIKTAFAEELEILQNLQPVIVSSEKISSELIDTYPELTEFLGGVRINCRLGKPATAKEIEQRFNDLRFKPDARDLNWYAYKILDTDLNAIEPERQINSFVYVSAEPEAGFRRLSQDEWQRFVDNETTKVRSAALLETSLPRVTQIDPSVGAEQKTSALIAIVLSLFAIVTYVWIRFGDVRYGLAAIAALVHDVCITLGAVTACTYIAATAVGQSLLIENFKIDLAMVAAFLTLIGYSLNDTIVVFDRIRENRRKAQLVAQTVTDSINQTISRTILTSFTTFVVVLIMYIFGGEGLRGFTFAIGFGIIIGTYSSIAIAAPILLLGHKVAAKKNR